MSTSAAGQEKQDVVIEGLTEGIEWCIKMINQTLDEGAWGTCNLEDIPPQLKNQNEYRQSLDDQTAPLTVKWS